MDEYISKQDVLDYLNGYLHSLGYGNTDLIVNGERKALINSIQDISAVKAADVQPVVHAKWEISSDGYYPYCSRCFGRPNGELTKYCPDCGARMDLDSVTHDRCSNYMDCDGHCFIDDTPCDCDENIEKCKGR